MIIEKIEDFIKKNQGRKDIPRVREYSSTPTREYGFPTEASSSPINGGIFNRSISSSPTGVELPKIQLQKFRGDITKFQAFWQSFQCAVDANESLSGVHKLNYLISSLEGQAYKALEGLEITEDNYGKAVEILKARYGKTQQVISSHMQELLNLHSYPNERVSQLRQIYDKIMVHVRGLESLGIASEKYVSLLIPVIMSRMPADITLQIARKTSDDVWSIDEIMDIIREELEAREMAENINVDTHKKHERQSRSTTSTFGTTKVFVANESGQVKKEIRCFFCTKRHFAEDCTEIKDVHKRMEILRAERRCLCCFKIGHLARNCHKEMSRQTSCSRMPKGIKARNRAYCIQYDHYICYQREKRCLVTSCHNVCLWRRQVKKVTGECTIRFRESEKLRRREFEKSTITEERKDRNLKSKYIW